MAERVAQKGKAVAQGMGLAFKVGCALFALLTPLLGVWGSSSLAAYLNGPVWAALLSGLLLFPILPLGWDALGEWRRRRREARSKYKRPRFLTAADRLILRTLAVNLAFIVGFLAIAPARAFEALSTRGDWMLDGSDGPTANALRRTLFWTAEKLEWLYRGSADNPFEDMGEGGSDVDPDLKPLPAPELPVDRTARPAGSSKPDTKTPERDAPDGEAGEGEADGAARDRSWPLPATLHPAVVNIPEEAERSIDGVAHYLAGEEKDPFWLTKALHDYVADRVAYDAVALADHRYPPQDAQTVFTTHLAVCAGYANLLVALGKAAGLRVVWVPGGARTKGWDIGGGGHAWNAVEIEGSWYLVDATWDAGSVEGRTFTKSYGTDYLFTPARLFGFDHFPDQARWQLRDAPLSRGEFLRQPMLKPRFFALGLELVSPSRSQVTVSGSIGIEIDNARGLFLLGTTASLDGGGGGKCTVENGPRAKLDCPLSSEGRFDVSLFANDERYGSYEYVGRIGVNNDL